MPHWIFSIIMSHLIEGVGCSEPCRRILRVCTSATFGYILTCFDLNFRLSAFLTDVTFRLTQPALFTAHRLGV
ncbi:hypothetical protein F9C07_2158480 [Aspergillus flavus]|uniref:Secreted protein n=1 Tax=Aspergillus flavus (strain ATCC 200026 / FGSC A1120 / IAM 13836 / NRRL 3357 / JCM 12722 / SRRC 167) TaxID=332952 RepID=A0A7U2QZE4_ASPFN|nr:hypothetical protein F9C07_2158480 [Aspergillus flavus]